MIQYKTFELFDRFLRSKGQRLELSISGGAALILLQVVDRSTRDVDVLEPTLSTSTRILAAEFAEQHPELGLDKATWLNDGVSVFSKDLKSGWERDVQALKPSAAEFVSTTEWVLSLFAEDELPDARTAIDALKQKLRFPDET